MVAEPDEQGKCPQREGEGRLQRKKIDLFYWVQNPRAMPNIMIGKRAPGPGQDALPRLYIIGPRSLHVFTLLKIELAEAWRETSRKVSASESSESVCVPWSANRSLSRPFLVTDGPCPAHG